MRNALGCTARADSFFCFISKLISCWQKYLSLLYHKTFCSFHSVSKKFQATRERSLTNRLDTKRKKWASCLIPWAIIFGKQRYGNFSHFELAQTLLRHLMRANVCVFVLANFCMATWKCAQGTSPHTLVCSISSNSSRKAKWAIEFCGGNEWMNEWLTKFIIYIS